MTTSSPKDPLSEVWSIKDSLSAGVDHSLEKTCQALYAEQNKQPGLYVNLGGTVPPKKTPRTASIILEAAAVKV